MSCRRPSNASSRVSGPWGPISARSASTSTMGRRRRAAAIASPSRVCAFSRTRSASSSAWKVARSTAAGRLSALAADPPTFVDLSFMAFLSVFRRRELLDDVGVSRAEHVQVIEYRSWVARPVHGGELGAAAAARSPANGFESRSAEQYFGPVVWSASDIFVFHHHANERQQAFEGPRAVGRRYAKPPWNPGPRTGR